MDVTVPLLSDTQVLIMAAAILFAVGAYLALSPDDREEPPPVRLGGDVDKDHALGGHRQVKAWGCKACERGER